MTSADQSCHFAKQAFVTNEEDDSLSISKRLSELDALRREIAKLDEHYRKDYHTDEEK